MTTALLFINLGTPQTTDASSIRHYLNEFLSDPRVIDIPAPIRWALLHGVILRTRPYQVRKAYQSIWLDEGSPLSVYSQRFLTKIKKQLPESIQAFFAMRYGQPSIKGAIDEIVSKNVEQLIIMPLFPQYSSAASGSAIEEALVHIKKGWNIPNLKIISDFFDQDFFIKPYANKIEQKLQEKCYDHVIFSYHGIPERHILKSGCERVCTKPCPLITEKNRYCYRAQCFATTRALVSHLNISQYTTTFQSRLGRTPWIRPYTDLELNTLFDKGAKNLLVACPSFVTDCLETLEEIQMRALEDWQALGGEQLTLVPCLNDDDHWVAGVAKFIQTL